MLAQHDILLFQQRKIGSTQAMCGVICCVADGSGARGGDGFLGFPKAVFITGDIK